MVLRHIAKSFNDVCLFSYFMTCFDMIFDGGFILETVQSCLEYMESLFYFQMGEKVFVGIEK